MFTITDEDGDYERFVTAADAALAVEMWASNVFRAKDCPTQIDAECTNETGSLTCWAIDVIPVPTFEVARRQ